MTIRRVEMRSPPQGSEYTRSRGGLPPYNDRRKHRGKPGANYIMAKNVLHISETEAASDFASLMARVRAGTEVIIESGKRPVAVLHAAEPVRRTISECIALAKAHEEETGKAPVLDPDFAEDLEEILNHRKPWNPPAWE